MNITKVAAWSEIVSSVAVLATLAYLAVQVQQNTAAVRAQTSQAMLDGDLRSLELYADKPDIWLSQMPEQQLTNQDKVRLHMSGVHFMRTREHHWLQYKNGTVSKAMWVSYRSAIPNVLGTERMRNWWTTIGSSAVDAKFVDEVNKMLEGIPYTDVWEQVLALK